MSDRIAVMHEGRIQQVGTPRELYETPANSFVAGFIGLTNLISGPAASAAGRSVIDLGDGDRAVVDGPLGTDAELQLAIRPECIRLADPSAVPAADESCVRGTVVDSVYHGASTTVVVELRGGVRLSVLASPVGPTPVIGETVAATWPSTLSYRVPGGALG